MNINLILDFFGVLIGVIGAIVNFKRKEIMWWALASAIWALNCFIGDLHV